MSGEVVGAIGGFGPSGNLSEVLRWVLIRDMVLDVKDLRPLYEVGIDVHNAVLWSVQTFHLDYKENRLIPELDPRHGLQEWMRYKNGPARR